MHTSSKNNRERGTKRSGNKNGTSHPQRDARPQNIILVRSHRGNSRSFQYDVSCTGRRLADAEVIRFKLAHPYDLQSLDTSVWDADWYALEVGDEITVEAYVPVHGVQQHGTMTFRLVKPVSIKRARLSDFPDGGGGLHVFLQNHPSFERIK